MASNKGMASRCLGPLLLVLASTSALADWSLQADRSHVVYTTTKVFADHKASAAENNQFTSLSGQISGSGVAQVGIALDSVATNVPVRDERMRNIVFETGRFPLASVQAQVPTSVLDQEGLHQIDLNMTLELKGVAKPLSVPVLVVNAGGELIVTSQQPVLVSAADFGLDAGVAELTKIAGLGYIPTSVPVSFQLVFRRG